MPYDITDAKEDITALYNEVAALEELLAKKGIIQLPKQQGQQQKAEPAPRQMVEEPEDEMEVQEDEVNEGAQWEEPPKQFKKDIKQQQKSKSRFDEALEM
jgi:hypothetical protein